MHGLYIYINTWWYNNNYPGLDCSGGGLRMISRNKLSVYGFHSSSCICTRNIIINDGLFFYFLGTVVPTVELEDDLPTSDDLDIKMVVLYIMSIF